MCEEIFNGIREANCIAHTITGARSVGYSLNVVFIATYVLQFHKTAKITERMPYRLPATHVPKKTNIELAKHRCRIRKNDVIVVIRERNYQIESGTFWRPRKVVVVSEYF